MMIASSLQHRTGFFTRARPSFRIDCYTFVSHVELHSHAVIHSLGTSQVCLLLVTLRRVERTAVWRHLGNTLIALNGIDCGYKLI